MKKTFLSSIFVFTMLSTAFSFELPRGADEIDIDSSTSIESPTKPIELKARARVARHRSRRHHSHAKQQIAQGTSSNWSGFAVTNNFNNMQSNTTTSVQGVWTVPTLSPTPSNTYSSIWVGIDGFNNDTVQQIGTEQDWIDGEQVNFAWFELFPNEPILIDAFPVRAGDLIGANVSYVGGSSFQLAIINYTTRITRIIPFQRQLDGTERNSAEWIVEAPSEEVAPGVFQVLPLANFGTVTFSSCQATLKGHEGSINDRHWQTDPLTMINPSTGEVKAIPTSLSSNGQVFTVTFESSGAIL